MTTLTTTTWNAPTGPVLKIIGALDFDTAPQLRAALDDIALQPSQLLVLDLSALAFCDSSGISAFLAARNLALASDATITLVAVPATTARILRTVGLQQVFAIHADTEAAISEHPSSADY